MVDSDHIMSLSIVTRRELLAGLAAVGVHPAETSISHGDDNTVLKLWRRWHAVRSDVQRLCHRQQILETQLIETVGFPQATVDTYDGKQKSVFSLEQLRDMAHRISPATRRRAKIELRSHQCRWDAADVALGYSRAKQAEEARVAEAQELAGALFTTPSTSSVEIEAKLECILAQGAELADDADFPWPQIRAVLADLQGLDR